MSLHPCSRISNTHYEPINSPADSSTQSLIPFPSMPLNSQSILTNKVVLPTLTEEEVARWKRVQACILGWNARNECFLTHQVQPFIEANFHYYHSKLQLDISRAVCIELNEISLNPKIYKGKSIQLNAHEKRYLFLKPGEPLDWFRCPFHLCLEIDESGDAIQLMIIMDKVVGEGIYKKVFPALDFCVPKRILEEGRHITQNFKIAIVSMDDLNKAKYGLKKTKDELKETMDMHKKILEHVTDGKFTEVPVALKPPFTNPTLLFRYKQNRFNSDIYQAAKTGKVPLNMHAFSPYVPFTFEDRLTVLNDVNKTLKAMHAIGYIHRDIKPKNILIRLTPQQKMEGIVNDFDLSSNCWVSLIEDNYCYWDVLSERGILSPITDYYSLTITFAVILIPAFTYPEFNMERCTRFLLDPEIQESFRKRAFTDHFYDALTFYDNLELNLLKMNFTMQEKRLMPCCSKDELDTLINNFKENQASILNVEHYELLKQIQNEISIIDRAISLVKHVVEKNYAMGKKLACDIEQIWWDIRYIKDFPQLWQYYRNQLVPLTFDPDYVSTEINNLTMLCLKN